MEENTAVTMLTPDQLAALLRRGAINQLRALLDEMHPADIADILEQVPPAQAVIAFSLLPDFEAGEVLDEANSDLTAALFDALDDERIADLIEALPSDDAVGLLEDLPEEQMERLLALMEPEESRSVRELLAWPEYSAGRLMRPDVAALRAQWTVAQATDYLRALPDVQRLHYLYVVDVVGRLIGVLPVRALVLNKKDARIGEIANYDVISVSAETDQEDLAELMSRYDFTAVPVVDQEGRLVGVVTIDDALDVLEEEATEDIQQLGGSSPLENPYFSVSVTTMVRKRIGWLLLLFFAALLSSAVLDSFTGLMETFIVLTIFIPLITGTGGNAGSQTVATIIRAISVEEVRFQDLGRVVRKEMSVGILMGILLGMFGFAYALLRSGDWHVGLVVALTLPLVVIWSKVAATVIPLLAERWGIDPTVVSAPMITTLVDASGLLIYLLLATALLGGGG
jgi:magnesium transporter